MRFPNGGKHRSSLYLILPTLVCLAVILYSVYEKEKGPDIILVSIDTLRADHVGCYGYKRSTTPHIDRLAKEGVFFAQAIAPGSDTYHSVPAIITSAPFHYQGYGGRTSALIDPLTQTLPEILSRHGYNTGVFSNAYPFKHIKGIERGAKTIVINDRMSAAQLTDTVLDWLRKNNRGKLFLWIHYFEPHPPYLPTPPYDSLFIHDKFDIDDKNIPIAPFDPSFKNNELATDKNWNGVDVIPYRVAQNNITSMNYYISLYDGEIRSVDDQVGRLLDMLHTLKRDKNTLIIVTADHGENMGEHHRYFTHGDLPYDTLVRVPLVLKYNPIRPGRKISVQVSLLDILPTVLEISRIKPPDYVAGESLLNILRNKGKDMKERYALSTCGSLVMQNIPVAYSLRTERWKLIYMPAYEKYLLYDLKNDKDESEDIFDRRGNEVSFLVGILQSWVKRDKTYMLPRSGQPSLDKDAAEKLKSLGYL